MGTIQNGKDILKKAEEELHEVIKAALKAQDYSAVQELARLGDGLAALLDGRGLAESPALQLRKVSPTPPQASSQGAKPVKTSRRPNEQGSPAGSQYPYFKRDGDRLVKVGWSKKNKSEYVHRVGRDAIRAICTHICHNVALGSLFDVEALGVPTDSEGREIPSYQVYLAIAWLRERGPITKKGRDGYVLNENAADEAQFEHLWNETPDGRV